MAMPCIICRFGCTICKSFKLVENFIVLIHKEINRFFVQHGKKQKSSPLGERSGGLFLRQQDADGEPPFFPLDGHGTVVLLGGGADAFQIVAAVGAAGGQAVRGKLHRGGAVVLEPQHHKAALGVDGHP